MRLSKLVKSYLLLIILGSISCRTAYQNITFNEKSVPLKPDYSESKSWAVLPGKYPRVLKDFEKIKRDQKADVFYIYPTLFSDKNVSDWNADIWTSSIRQDVFDTAVKYQASAWQNAGDLYVPFYRQAHYRIFVEPDNKMVRTAWEIAYEDVKNAFQYYLKHYNKGKPIIIASHSQGSMHAKRLIKEFFDSKPMRNQLVAAYLIGARVLPNEFNTIQPLEDPKATGGFISWNAYKMNNLPKNYNKWFQGGVTTNPITWDTQNTSKKSNHKGLLSKDLKLYPKSLNIELVDGILWTSLPEIPGRIFLSLIKNYHFADINLFWKDIEQNAIARVDSWYKKKHDENK
ncbi:MAG: hypothetical protein CBD31_04310 [Flavobacteriaceae bacterium TMED171]|nr:hypothetical protein [Flavobacteriaceae bacterium]OUW31466.1 MAG: hypothetical protein CBD31_04310 [Flavobacteriaceae bacterium TMED171]